MCKRFYIGILVLFLVGCGGKQVPTKETRLEEFTKYINEVAISMELPVPNVIAQPGMYVHGEVQVAAFMFDSPFTDEPIYGVHVSEDFLLTKPSILLKHVATHEICHIYLETTMHPNGEIDAERCVFLHVGEDAFMRVYYYLYKDMGVSTLLWPTVEDVRKVLGLES
jgi:hypothetical protein